MIKELQAELEKREFMKKVELELRKRTGSNLEEIDPITWIEENIYIEDPQAASQGKPTTFKFKLWPEQRQAIGVIEKNNRVIILKSRQLGISWLIQAYALYIALRNPSTNILILSSTLKASKEVIRRFKFMYDNLENKPVDKGDSWNTTLISFSNNSRINAFAPTERAGASFTATFVIADEFALMPNSEAVYNSIKPTIDDGGKIVILSTARPKTGQLFESIFRKSIAGQNDYANIFLPWWVRPTRTREWYEQALFSSSDKGKFKQEFPETIDDAFAAVGEDRFVTREEWDDCFEIDLKGTQEIGISSLTSCPYIEWKSSLLNKRTKLVWGLDGSVKSDTTALVGITSEDGIYKIMYLLVYSPSAKNEVDFSELEEKILELWKFYDSKSLVYDIYQLADMGQRLIRNGIPALAFPQGAKRWEADTLLKNLIQLRRIKHGGIEILNEHIESANASVDANERVRIEKFNKSSLIDTIVAISMAVYRLTEISKIFKKPRPIIINTITEIPDFTRKIQVDVSPYSGLIFTKR